MIPLKGLNHAGVTVNFYIKVYGFTIKDKIDIIYLGEHLKINYNADINSDYFGLNLVTFKGSSETVVSNYNEFRKHLGIWTFISVSSYDATYETFFPPMIRFEINHKRIPIIGPLNYISIGTIYFADELFALVQRVKVYTTYLIGTNSLETKLSSRGGGIVDYDKYLASSNTSIDGPFYESYFMPVDDKSECLFANFDLIGTDKENDDIIIDNYECEIDNINEIYLKGFNLENNTFYQFENEITANKKYDCHDDCKNLCFGSSRYDCTCNFINDEKKIFLGNVSYHFCKNLDSVNFAKMNRQEVNITKTGGSKFTLHFWVFAFSYVDKVFEGFTIEWKGHTTVQIKIDSTSKYFFTCFIDGKETRKYVEFYMNEWNFLHCAVNYPDSKFYIASENKEYEYGFTYDDIPKATKQPQSMIFEDLTTVKDWGYLFFKYIRIWNDAYRHSSFLSRLKITSNYFDTNLLYQWNTTYNDAHEVKGHTK